MSDITPETLVAATPPTVELVAGLLTDADNDFHDGYLWKLHMSASGNVVNIGVEPSTDPDDDDLDDDGEWLPEVHFRAVVVEAPPYAAAAEPVTIDGDTARELAYSDPGDTVAGWTVVANEYIEKQRWESLHQLVIRNEQGEHFADTYSKGLTEYQSTGAYEDADTARFTPVVPTFKVVTEWKAARKPAPAQTGGAK